LLAEYEEPRLDAAKDEELRDYMARRSSEIPAVDALNNEF
jgi:trimethylamine--corrinoid protein Co-methyltransferase